MDVPIFPYRIEKVKMSASSFITNPDGSLIIRNGRDGVLVLEIHHHLYIQATVIGSGHYSHQSCYHPADLNRLYNRSLSIHPLDISSTLFFQRFANPLERYRNLTADVALLVSVRLADKTPLPPDASLRPGEKTLNAET